MPVPADVKLWVFNQALMHLGARKLTSLDESTERQRVLNGIWDSAFIDFLLEQGQWKFAMRTMSLSYSPSVEPAFGFTKFFTKPDDLKRLCALSSDEFFSAPELRYQDVGLYWAADQETIYIRYVSNDEAFGSDLTRWTATFQLYASYVLAKRAAPRIKNETTVAELEALMKKHLADALALDAQAEPTKFPPRGRWLTARMSGIARRDRTGGWR